MRVATEFHFCAAHHLPRYEGPCRNPHGHNYRLVVSLSGRPEPASGMVSDFYAIRRVVGEEVLARVDHQDFNALLENPTAENIVRWMWQTLKPRLPLLSELSLYETHDCWVVYRGEDEPQSRASGVAP